MKKLTILSFAIVAFIQPATATMNTMDAKKSGDQQIRQLIEPVLKAHCEKCEITNIETEVDVAVDDVTAPGFEETGAGKMTLTPASAKVSILFDETLGVENKKTLVDFLNKKLKVVHFPVEVTLENTKFPQPASLSYKIAELRERVNKEIKNSLTTLIGQFCPKNCVLGEFDVKTEVVNAADVNYASGQDYYQDGPAAIRVRAVKANLMVDEALPIAEANGILEMAKLKVSQFKNTDITSQIMKFPKSPEELAELIADNQRNGYNERSPASSSQQNKDTKESRDSRDHRESKESRDSRENRDTKESRDSKESRSENVSKSETGNKSERFEKYEKIERVENGDEVQKTLDKFRFYGIVISGIILALLFSLVAISFREQIFSGFKKDAKGASDAKGEHKQHQTFSGDQALTSDEKAAMIGRRIESDRLFNDLTDIFSEQPKIAKHVFTNILIDEGVEEIAQYLEMFGESVIMDLLKDPTLQADVAELMDFYTKNTFDLNDEERSSLLKKLHHRTVTAKMQVYGTRSATLFDFLSEMEANQISDMVKTESNTVKAIVLTQSDQKKRQAVFNSYDDQTRLKLMTELTRIDHLPKNYIFNVASALRRKKAENPKYNTEALPGSDVLVSFLEKSGLSVQKSIVQQLMSSSSGDAVHALKAKLASLETIRYIKDSQVTEIATSLKHDELVQFLKGTSADIRDSVLNKVPQDLAIEISEEIQIIEPVGRETYITIERKVLNKIKNLATQGQLNLAELNERMFATEFGFDQTTSEVDASDMRKVG